MTSWITNTPDRGLNLANYFPVTSGVELLSMSRSEPIMSMASSHQKTVLGENWWAPPSHICEYQEPPGSTNIGTISGGTGRVDVHSGLQRWDKSDLYDPGSSRDKEARALMPEKRRKVMSDEDVRNGNKPKPTRQASRPHKRRRIPLATKIIGWDSEMFPQPLRLRTDFRDLSPTMLDSSSRGNSASRCRRRREERESRILRESRRAGPSRLKRDFRNYSPTISSCSGEGSSVSWCDGYREKRESRTFRDYSPTISSCSGEGSSASWCDGYREKQVSRTFRDYSPTISSCSGEGSSALWCDGYRESCTWRRL